jgi:hypothetical protein
MDRVVLAGVVRYSAAMTRLEKALILAWISSAAAVLTTQAVVNETAAPDRNYRVIVERNPFGLKPPPPPPTNAPPPVAPKDEILLTGITSLGTPRAYFMTKAPQGKSPEYYSLGPDEKKSGLEVVEINPKEGSVRVRNGGIEKLMTFASDGVKAPSAPAAAPGTPGGPTIMVPGATAGPVITTPGINPPGTVATASRGGVTPGVGVNAATAVNPPATGRIRTIPSRSVRTPIPAPDPNERPDPNAAVQDVLMMELQKRANPNITFPPTPMPQ